MFGCVAAFGAAALAGTPPATARNTAGYGPLRGPLVSAGLCWQGRPATTGHKPSMSQASSVAAPTVRRPATAGTCILKRLRRQEMRGSGEQRHHRLRTPQRGGGGAAAPALAKKHGQLPPLLRRLAAVNEWRSHRPVHGRRGPRPPADWRGGGVTGIAVGVRPSGWRGPWRLRRQRAAALPPLHVESPRRSRDHGVRRRLVSAPRRWHRLLRQTRLHDEVPWRDRRASPGLRRHTTGSWPRLHHPRRYNPWWRH